MNIRKNNTHLKRIPTTIITGFLEAGKTTFIQRFLESNEVNRYEHILLLSCEDGDIEYAPDRFKSDCVEIHHFETVHEFETSTLLALADAHRANRIIIEHNGIWSLAETLTKLPDSFYITEIITLINGNTFNLYSVNLRPMFVDKLRFTHKVMLNQIPNAFDMESFERFIAAAAPKAKIMLCAPDGELHAMDSAILPTAMENAESITISDDDFSVMYRQVFMQPEAYEGKCLNLNGRLIKDAFGNCVIGRYTLVCCMADLAFSGFVCGGNIDLTQFVGEWVTVSGMVSISYQRSYGQSGPVLNLISIKTSTPPITEIILP